MKVHTKSIQIDKLLQNIIWIFSKVRLKKYSSIEKTGQSPFFWDEHTEIGREFEKVDPLLGREFDAWL